MRTLRGVIAGAAIALLLTGCSAGGTSGEAAEQPADQASSLDTTTIMDGIESAGLVCTEKDPVLDGREEVIQCKGDDYIFVTATRFTSVEERDGQIERAKKALCEGGTVATLRLATSDTWALVPGDDREQDVAAFDTAMSALGLEWGEDACA